MQVILIRHGQTAGNARRRYIGRTDEPLSPEGEAMAAQVGADPGVELVYVSPMRRAKQTAELLFPNARQVVYGDLREMDFGDFEGRSAADMEGDRAYRAWVEGNCLAPCPNGEGQKGFTLRVCAALSAALDDAAARGERRAVFVVHGGTIMSALSALSEGAGEYYSYSCGNCGGYRCTARREDGGWRLFDVEQWDGVIQPCENHL